MKDKKKHTFQMAYSDNWEWLYIDGELVASDRNIDLYQVMKDHLIDYKVSVDLKAIAEEEGIDPSNAAWYGKEAEKQCGKK